MTPGPARRAGRRPALAGEPLIGREPYDYADAFEILGRESDTRSAEEFARCAFEHAPRLVQRTVTVAHRCVLRLRLGPSSSPDHLFGWRILTSAPDVLQLEAVSPLLGRGVIVGRKPDPTRVVVTTYVFFARPVLSRLVWRVVSPLHRRIAPILLERAAACARHTDDMAAVG